MYTSVGILALAGFLVAPSPSARTEPLWWRDYYVAQEKGVLDKKPLAVFVGHGQGGHAQLTQEGQLNDRAKKVLCDSYVCVYLDAGSKSHEELIKALAVTKGKGLVISDRTGSLQAFHHDGQISEGELVRQLQHFAQSAVEIRTTVTNVQPRVSYYPSGGATSRPATYAPAFSGGRNC